MPLFASVCVCLNVVMSGLGFPGSGVLAIDPERVIEAAGALDELVASYSQMMVPLPGTVPDAGHHDVTAAATLFWTAWTNGLEQLLDRQSGRADALRKAVDALVGQDADTAYAIRSALGAP